MRIVGPVFSNRIDGSTGPISSTSSSWTILTICCSGRTLLISCCADGLLVDPLHELLDDVEVHVGFQERGADLAQPLLDVGLGQHSRARNRPNAEERRF